MPKVLIVDDEPGIRFALKRWFERQQWTVTEAQDGHGALEAIRRCEEVAETALDLIVCDLHLPGMSGEEIVLELRAQRPLLAQRLIITTGDAIDDAIAGSVLATHAHVLQKPFDLGMLRTAVEKITAS